MNRILRLIVVALMMFFIAGIANAQSSAKTAFSNKFIKASVDDDCPTFHIIHIYNRSRNYLLINYLLNGIYMKSDPIAPGHSDYPLFTCAVMTDEDGVRFDAEIQGTGFDKHTDFALSKNGTSSVPYESSITIP